MHHNIDAATVTIVVLQLTQAAILTQTLEDVTHGAVVHLRRAVEHVHRLAQLRRQVLGGLSFACACRTSWRCAQAQPACLRSCDVNAICGSWCSTAVAQRRCQASALCRTQQVRARCCLMHHIAACPLQWWCVAHLNANQSLLLHDLPQTGLTPSGGCMHHAAAFTTHL